MNSEEPRSLALLGIPVAVVPEDIQIHLMERRLRGRRGLGQSLRELGIPTTAPTQTAERLRESERPGGLVPLRESACGYIVERAA